MQNFFFFWGGGGGGKRGLYYGLCASSEYPFSNHKARSYYLPHFGFVWRLAHDGNHAFYLESSLQFSRL